MALCYDMIYSVIANDGMFEGNIILKKETIERMKQPATGDTCAVTGLPKAFSLGMQVFHNQYQVCLNLYYAPPPLQRRWGILFFNVGW